MQHKNIFNLITKSILAGLLISLAGIVYLNCPDKIVGSLLFSLGLYAVLEYQGKLFTGMIGSVNSKRSILDCGLALIFNLLTAVCVGLIFRFTLGENLVFDNIVNQSWYQVLIESCICGSLIHIACTVYKSTKNPLIVVLCVMAFILSGALHSIACGFYIALGNISWKAVLYLLLIIIGNSIGALGIRFLIESKK